MILRIADHTPALPNEEEMARVKINLLFLFTNVLLTNSLRISKLGNVPFSVRRMVSWLLAIKLFIKDKIHHGEGNHCLTLSH